MISLLHPSRSRPEKSVATLNKWVSNCNNDEDIEIIISIDSDDPEYSNYCKGMFLHLYPVKIYPRIRIEENKNRSAVDAINNAAKVTVGDILIVVSDDTEPLQNWDQLIKNSVGSKTDWILKTQDGIQPWIITMPIMDRVYYNRFGYIYHPDYQHMFCDTELTCVADLTGRKLTSNLLFPHKHYSVTKEQPDAINKKADATWAQGEKLFIERYKRNFDLKETKGKIIDNGMIQYIQNKIR